jgi:hypothetical protein
MASRDAICVRRSRLESRNCTGVDCSSAHSTEGKDMTPWPADTSGGREKHNGLNNIHRWGCRIFTVTQNALKLLRKN